MKSVYKLLIDIGPLAIFFIFYTRGEEGAKLQSAILPLMIATIVAILFSYILEKKIPIHFVGLGEKVDDLHEFSAKSFAQSMLELDN